MAHPSVAIVMPTLDEAESLTRVLPAALASGADEVVISDGESTDGTRELASRLGARVIAGRAGRGAQLNRGAAACRAGALLFLHADTLLPEGGIGRVREAIAGGASGGGFLVRFAERGRLLRFGERVVNLRTRTTRLPLGDQAQFASREAFARLGGFAEWPILEDLDFARRLKRHGPVAILGPPVTTSARRFLAGGPLRTVAKNWLIWACFALGASPQRLARLYPPVPSGSSRRHEGPGAMDGAPGPGAGGRGRLKLSG